MFENFTDRARKVFSIATQESLGLNLDIIDSEHVLLGLLKENSGYAHNILMGLEVEYGNARKKILYRTGKTEIARNYVTNRTLPQTTLVKKIITTAIEKARELNKNYVGTEHLLFGLANATEGVAHDVLYVDYKLDKAVLIKEIGKIMGIVNKTDKPSKSDEYFGVLLAIKAIANSKNVCNKEIIENIKKLIEDVKE